MLRFLKLITLLSVACSACCCVPVLAQPATSDRFELVPMRDGVRLGTHIWFPEGQGPWPVVLIRTPYGAKEVLDWELRRLRENGYCIVAQDMRGRFSSEGSAPAFTADGWAGPMDGYDCVEWIARQQWCNGSIGTWGKSGPGITQTLMAGAAPPSLDCQHIGFAASDLFRQGFYQGGQLRLSMAMWWLMRGGWNLQEHAQLAAEHPVYDDFWKNYNLLQPDVHPAAPMLNYAGWYDIFLQGAIEAWQAGTLNGTAKARRQQLLILGPWPHGIAKDFGLARLPQNALTPPMIDPLLWFDRHLKGKDNELADAKPVYYYTIGDVTSPTDPLNRWREADGWPVPHTDTPLYLSGEGGLSRTAPEVGGRPRSFMYDPLNPVPTLGGNNLHLDKGPFDNRELEKRPDVLVYTSPELAEDLEVTGSVRVRLFVSSSAPDTDFTAKLCDVYPDGRSLNVLDGIIRMRFHQGVDREVLLQPGRIYEAEIDLWSTSWVFRKGHRIRLDVSSSNYPRFETNPNTGERLLLSVDLNNPQKPNPDYQPRKARNTVFADSAHPSALILPVAEGYGVRFAPQE